MRRGTNEDKVVGSHAPGRVGDSARRAAPPDDPSGEALAEKLGLPWLERACGDLLDSA